MIINIFEENFCLYKNITNAENLIVKYEKLFTDVIVEKIKSKIIGNEKDIDCVVKAIECFTGRTFFPCKKINGKNLCCVFTSKKEIIFENENEKISIVCNVGNILIIGNKIISQWNFKIPNDVLLFDDTNIYSVINLNLETCPDIVIQLRLNFLKLSVNLSSYKYLLNFMKHRHLDLKSL